MDFEDLIEDEHGAPSSFDKKSSLIASAVACDAIVTAEADNNVVIRQIDDEIFSVHFVRAGLPLSTSFDHKYDIAKDQWETRLHFRWVYENDSIDPANLEFPNLWELLEKDLLPLFIANDWISNQTVVDRSLSEEFNIRSSKPDDIMRLNILLLDILEIKDDGIAANPQRTQWWLDVKHITLPTIASHFPKWEAKRPDRNVVSFPSSKPPGFEGP